MATADELRALAADEVDWQARAERAEALLETARAGRTSATREYCAAFNRALAAEETVARLIGTLEQIATGKIIGEPKNHRDTLAIIRDLARAAITTTKGEKA